MSNRCEDRCDLPGAAPSEKTEMRSDNPQWLTAPRQGEFGDYSAARLDAGEIETAEAPNRAPTYQERVAVPAETIGQY